MFTPPGLAAYKGRDPKLQNRYSFENRDIALDASFGEGAPRRTSRRGRNFNAMPLSYRRPAIWWVMSAKRAETKARRLATLIADSAAGRKIKHLRRPGET